MMTDEEIHILKIYIFVFLAGAVFDVVRHYFAYRDSVGKFGFKSSLMPYYNSFRTASPKDIPGAVKSTLYGAFLGGISCIIVLLMAHLMLYISEELEFLDSPHRYVL